MPVDAGVEPLLQCELRATPSSPMCTLQLHVTSVCLVDAYSCIVKLVLTHSAGTRWNFLLSSANAF